MIAIPTETPVITGLNSYYLNIERFFEHYQGAIGTGAIGFHSPTANAAVFFDEDRFLNGVIQEKNQTINGSEAIRRLIRIGSSSNFNVSVYALDPEMVYFWAALPDAQEVYKGLSAEFTDLDALTAKMAAEKLTGYIDVAINGGDAGGVYFFNNGMPFAQLDRGKRAVIQYLDIFPESVVSESREKGGVFNVCRIVFDNARKGLVISSITQQKAPAPGSANRPPATADKAKTLNPVCLVMAQQLLQILEKMVKGHKKIRTDFDTMFKSVCVKKVDDFDFLDPFAAEFIYAAGRVEFFGRADDATFMRGILACAMEVASQAGIQERFVKHLAPWQKKYSAELNRLKIVVS